MMQHHIMPQPIAQNPIVDHSSDAVDHNPGSEPVQEETNLTDPEPVTESITANGAGRDQIGAGGQCIGAGAGRDQIEICGEHIGVLGPKMSSQSHN